MDDTDATLLSQMKSALANIPVSFMQSRARKCRDAMRALKELRAANKSCEPSAVKVLMGVQKRHRMAYESLNAQVALAAQMEVSDELKKEAAKLETRRCQQVRTKNMTDRGAE